MQQACLGQTGLDLLRSWESRKMYLYEHIHSERHWRVKAVCIMSPKSLLQKFQLTIFNPAIVLCDPLTREYLINYARTLIYTTAMSHPTLIAIRCVYELMQQGKTQSVRLFNYNQLYINTNWSLAPVGLAIQHFVLPLALWRINPQGWQVHYTRWLPRPITDFLPSNKVSACSGWILSTTWARSSAHHGTDSASGTGASASLVARRKYHTGNQSASRYNSAVGDRTISKEL